MLVIQTQIELNWIKISAAVRRTQTIRGDIVSLSYQFAALPQWRERKQTFYVDSFVK